MSDTEPCGNWWERTAEMPYPGLHQGTASTCVFAAVGGAVNHLLGEQAWTIDSLVQAHPVRHVALLAVAETAIAPFIDRLEAFEHKDSRQSNPLSPAIRSWISEGGIVILSLVCRETGSEYPEEWHMFTLVACTDTSFQVWDSNGDSGSFNDHDIKTGIHVRGGRFYHAHPEQHLVVIRKRCSIFPQSP